MRWLFLLLLVLNAFYYVWHQQEAPLRAKDVTPLSLYRGPQQDIRLLSESSDSVSGVIEQKRPRRRIPAYTSAALPTSARRSRLSSASQAWI